MLDQELIGDYSPRALSLAGQIRGFARIAMVLLISFVVVGKSPAYSVLTHEEIVDLVWTSDLVPMLKSQYPGLTEDQIKEAHAYAYGGAVIQDLGYYPFGSPEFSNMLHYVRSGDFVAELLRESQNADEFAFSLGALAHYVSDIWGHPAVNQAVAIEYPKLEARYGKSVTYAEDHSAHIRTEFGFDMVQVAKQRYASKQYHDFIGFKVSQELLERVFPVVYGLELKDVLPHEGLTIGSYRYAVSQLIPKMTQVALATRKEEMVKEQPDFAKKEFLYRLSRTEYEKEWGKDYERPGKGARFIAFFMRLVPKIGPFKALAFNVPTPRTEDLYFKSINATVDNYRERLHSSHKNAYDLPDFDFDTGKETKAGEYSLADETYAKLLTHLSKNNFAETTPKLRTNILHFYSDLNAPYATKKDPAQWQAVLTSLDQLKAASTTPAPAIASHGGRTQ